MARSAATAARTARREPRSARWRCARAHRVRKARVLTVGAACALRGGNRPHNRLRSRPVAALRRATRAPGRDGRRRVAAHRKGTQRQRRDSALRSRLAARASAVCAPKLRRHKPTSAFATRNGLDGFARTDAASGVLLAQVGSGEAVPEALVPIDVHCDKLIDWLVDRKRLAGDWRPKLAALRSRAASAAASLPPELVAGVPAVDGAPAPDYAACVALRDAAEAAAGGAESRGLFGRRAGAARDWDALAKAYERDALQLPEAAQVRGCALLRAAARPCHAAKRKAAAPSRCAD